MSSKVAIIRVSQQPDADVDYIFAQGVGPFAINKGLVKIDTWVRERKMVRIYSMSKDIILVAHVAIPTVASWALERGDDTISGCPGIGAPILIDHSNTSSHRRGTFQNLVRLMGWNLAGSDTGEYPTDRQ
ncbi:hypothetical protein F5Y16DRAFT_405833 [Xylariaceae sp. FL0255]|nr:hypothetical protein F5Y16DRAFT_405833 [Xylariaceae sp. FL0255]